MEKQLSLVVRIFLFLLAITGWFALIVQFYLIIANRQTPIAEAITRYFTFFTILTNILVTVCSTVLLLKLALEWRKFFSKTTTLTAIAVDIIIVGGSYKYGIQKRLCITQFGNIQKRIRVITGESTTDKHNYQVSYRVHCPQKDITPL